MVMEAVPWRTRGTRLHGVIGLQIKVAVVLVVKGVVVIAAVLVVGAVQKERVVVRVWW